MMNETGMKEHNTGLMSAQRIPTRRFIEAVKQFVFSLSLFLSPSLVSWQWTRHSFFCTSISPSVSCSISATGNGFLPDPGGWKGVLTVPDKEVTVWILPKYKEEEGGADKNRKPGLIRLARPHTFTSDTFQQPLGDTPCSFHPDVGLSKSL